MFPDPFQLPVAPILGEATGAGLLGLGATEA